MTFRVLSMALALSALPLLSVAQTSQERGLEIAREADKRGEGFGDFQADMRMVLITRRGGTSERELQVSTLEGTGDDGDLAVSTHDTLSLKQIRTHHRQCHYGLHDAVAIGDRGRHVAVSLSRGTFSLQCGPWVSRELI